MLKEILPTEVFFKFYEHVIYILFLPHTEYTNVNISSWEIFTELFFAIVDQDFSKGQFEPEILPKVDQFEKMLNSRMGKHLLKGLKHTIKHEGCNTRQFDYRLLFLTRFSQNFTSKNVKEFGRHTEDIFNVMHLMHEDMKLNMFNNKLIEQGTMVDFLFRFCLKLGPIKFSYSENYLREYPQLLDIYGTEYNRYIEIYFEDVIAAKEHISNYTLNMIVPEVLSKNMAAVPSIYQWVEAKLDQNQSNYNTTYQCYFETSRKVCRLYDIFNDSETVSKGALHPLLKKPKYEDESMEVEVDFDYHDFPLLGAPENVKHINGPVPIATYLLAN